MAILKRKVAPESIWAGLASVVDGISEPSALLEIAEEKGLSTTPLDVRGLVESLGIGLRTYPMDSQQSGYLRLEEGRWIIGVNSLHHPKRQRFTMAHELGHYFLHKETMEDFEDTVLFRADGYGDIPTEKQANLFAAHLLMPEDKFREAVIQTGGVISKMSEMLGVSALAITYRARELGYGQK